MRGCDVFVLLVSSLVAGCVTSNGLRFETSRPETAVIMGGSLGLPLTKRTDYSLNDYEEEVDEEEPSWHVEFPYAEFMTWGRWKQTDRLELSAGGDLKLALLPSVAVGGGLKGLLTPTDPAQRVHFAISVNPSFRMYFWDDVLFSWNVLAGFPLSFGRDGESLFYLRPEVRIEGFFERSSWILDVGSAIGGRFACEQGRGSARGGADCFIEASVNGWVATSSGAPHETGPITFLIGGGAAF